LINSILCKYKGRLLEGMAFVFSKSLEVSEKNISALLIMAGITNNK